MIRIEDFCVRLGEFVLEDINLTIHDGEYFIILGPTGAGKTVLLESIAGLHPVKKGSIWLNDKNITNLNPEKREISIVYQDYVLFPHLLIKDNILFGLRLRKKSTAEIKDTLEWLIELLEIRHLIDRRPQTLSGGERQKVALARALAIKPSLLLLDEPLSALDPETRESLQLELKRIHQELNLTVIHVTHDFDEALVLGKHIAVIGEGRIRQVGTPEEIFRKPNSEFVARFTMMRNILSGELVSQNDGISVFRSGSIELATVTHKEQASYACIRPDDISISADVSFRDGLNSFNGTISRIEERGMEVHVIVDVPPEICCSITRRDFSEMRLTTGQNITITFNPDSVHVF